MYLVLLCQNNECKSSCIMNLELLKCIYNLRPHGLLHTHNVPFQSTYLFGNVRCVCFLWLVHFAPLILEIEGESSLMLTSSLPSFVHYITICHPCITFFSLHNSLSCPTHQTRVHCNRHILIATFFVFIDTKHRVQSSPVHFFIQLCHFFYVNITQDNSLEQKQNIPNEPSNNL